MTPFDEEIATILRSKESHLLTETQQKLFTMIMITEKMKKKIAHPKDL